MPVGDMATFDLTPSIRDFARGELTAVGDLEATEGAWTSWLAARARSAAQSLYSPNPDAWWDWLERAHDRLLHALQVCLARHRADAALDLLAALAPQWVNRAVYARVPGNQARMGWCQVARGIRIWDVPSVDHWRRRSPRPPS
jgi:hypothetical protein